MSEPIDHHCRSSIYDSGVIQMAESFDITDLTRPSLLRPYRLQGRVMNLGFIRSRGARLTSGR